MRWVWRAGLLLSLVVGWQVAMSKGEGSPDWFEHADKLRHAVAFVAYWALGVLAGVRPRWALAVGLLAFGVAVEWGQSFTPDRDPSWGDVLADAAGLALGAALERVLRPESRTPPAGP